LFGYLAVGVPWRSSSRTSRQRGGWSRSKSSQRSLGDGELTGRGFAAGRLGRQRGHSGRKLPGRQRHDGQLTADVVLKSLNLVAEGLDHLVRGDAGEEVHQVGGLVEGVLVGRRREERRPNGLKKVVRVVLATEASGQVPADDAADVRAEAVKDLLRSLRAAGPTRRIMASNSSRASNIRPSLPAERVSASRSVVDLRTLRIVCRTTAGNRKVSPGDGFGFPPSHHRTGQVRPNRVRIIRNRAGSRRPGPGARPKRTKAAASTRFGAQAVRAGCRPRL